MILLVMSPTTSAFEFKATDLERRENIAIKKI